MKPTRLLALASVILVPGLPACGGSQQAAQPTTPPAEAATAPSDVPPPPPDIPFEEMTKNQRGSFMFHVVLPEMTKEFAAVDPKYQNMDCKTCHGQGAVDKTFKMPNPDLPHLPTTPEGFAKLQQEKPQIVQFMAGTVKPKMASLLQIPEYDMKTQTGEFGCQNCHVMGEGTPTP